MKTILILCFTILNFSNIYSQARLKHFSKCDSKKYFSVNRGDTIIIDCDTVLLSNPRYTEKYNEIYKFYIKDNQSLEKRVLEQQNEYQKLKTLHDTLLVKSINYIDSTNVELNSIQLSINTSIKNIDTTKQEIKQIRKDIKESLHSSISKKNLLWGAGGIIVGIVLCLIIQ